MGTIATVGSKHFEALKQINPHGAEFWSARDLQPLLGYSQWRRFEDAIKRAQISCQEAGNTPENHFAGAGKMVTLGSESAGESSNGDQTPHRPLERQFSYDQ